MVQELFESKQVSRSDKTRLVNENVEKGPEGKWHFALKPTVLESLTTSYSSVMGKTRDKAYPKAVAIGKCGGEANFVRGLQEGDIEAVDEGGKRMYKFRCVEIETAKGCTSQTNHKQQEHASADATKQFLAFCESFQPELVPSASFQDGDDLPPLQSSSTTAPSASLAASSRSSPIPLAICDGAVDLQPADPKVLGKVEDALNWLSTAKTATMKLKKLEGSVTYTNLKQELDATWEVLLPLQANLEQIRLCGKASLTKLKAVMKQFSQRLLQAQELIKSINALQ